MSPAAISFVSTSCQDSFLRTVAVVGKKTDQVADRRAPAPDRQAFQNFGDQNE